MVAQYNLQFTDSQGNTLVLNDATVTTVRTLGRTGDWGNSPHAPVIDISPDGDEGIVGSVKFQLPVLEVQVDIYPGSSTLWDVADTVSNVMAPIAADGNPNRGYVTITRNSDITTPDAWRIPAVPLTFQLTKPFGESLNYFRTVLRFQGLSAYWEDATQTANQKVLKAAADPTWSTVTVSENPGGNGACYPTWYISGPASGTITSISIINNTTGKRIDITGLSMGSSGTLQITTAFAQKDITISGISYYKLRGPLTEFFTLLPAANSLTFTKNTTSQSSVKVSYRKRRIGL